MRKIKRIVCLCLVLLMVLCLTPVFSENEPSVPIYLEGKLVANGILLQDRTFVPIRFLSEALGFDVLWDGDARSVTVSNGGLTNVLYIGKTSAMRYSGELQEEIKMDVAPMLMHDRTYVPLRYVAESLDCGVQWQGATGQVHLQTPIYMELNGLSFSTATLSEEEMLSYFGGAYDTLDGADGVRRYVYFSDDTGAMTVFGFTGAQLFEFFTNDMSLKYNDTVLSEFSSAVKVTNATHVLYDTFEDNRPVALYHCAAGALYNPYFAEENKAAVMQTEEKLVYYLTNSLRRLHGAPTLIYSENLADVDRAHVAELVVRGELSHTDLQGGGIRERLAGVPVYSKYMLAGEVLAKMPNAYCTAYGWLNSQKHRECILDANYVYSGVCVDGVPSRNLYYAQILVKLK